MIGCDSHSFFKGWHVTPSSRKHLHSSAFLWLWGLCSSLFFLFSSVIFACSVWLCQVRSDGDALYEEIYECVSTERRRLQLCLKSLPFCLPLMSPSVLIPVNGYKSRALNSLPGPIQGNWLSEQTYCCSICCSFTFLCHREQKPTLLSGIIWLNYICYPLCCLLACI